jgi:hypothetical protein
MSESPAIEADILLGMDTGKVGGNTTRLCVEPIMAHPPDRTSDLSFAHFMALALKNTALQKHIKLDFKEIEAVQPCLDTLNTLPIYPNGKFIFLNADIIPGPGRSNEDISCSGSPIFGPVPKSRFVEKRGMYCSEVAHYYPTSEISKRVSFCPTRQQTIDSFVFTA